MKPSQLFEIFDVPPPLQPVEGGGSVKGKREIRDEVSF
jgi:hypothetical protein